METIHTLVPFFQSTRQQPLYERFHIPTVNENTDMRWKYLCHNLIRSIVKWQLLYWIVFIVRGTFLEILHITSNQQQNETLTKFSFVFMKKKSFLCKKKLHHWFSKDFSPDTTIIKRIHVTSGRSIYFHLFSLLYKLYGSSRTIFRTKMCLCYMETNCSSIFPQLPRILVQVVVNKSLWCHMLPDKHTLCNQHKHAKISLTL